MNNWLEMADVRLMLDKAGIEYYSVHEIPNEYNSSDRPWMRVNGPYGYLKIGWRKRVIEIDWYNTPVRVTLATANTVGPFYVHAWGVEEAVELLRQLSVNIAQWKRYDAAIPTLLRGCNIDAGFDEWMPKEGRSLLSFLHVEDYKEGEFWLRLVWKASRMHAQQAIAKQLGVEIRSEETSRLTGG